MMAYMLSDMICNAIAWFVWMVCGTAECGLEKLDKEVRIRSWKIKIEKR